MIFVDTGYLVALTNPADHLHARAMKWANVIDEPVFVTEYVLWEVVNYFSQPPHRSKVHRLIEHIQTDSSYEIIFASPHILDLGLSLHRDRQDKAWSLTDCISFNVMAERSATRALSHDVHFEQAQFEALLRRDP